MKRSKSSKPSSNGYDECPMIPGGLLRRKFRYESIQRLRKGEEPDEDIRW